MTNRELAAKLESLVHVERRTTNEILKLILLALDRRAYLELGFSSMFDWLVRGFGYSKASAYRRIEAARFLREAPQGFERLASGAVNLTTLSKAQKFSKGRHKELVLSAIENKSSEEAEQVLLSMFPDARLEVHQERRTIIDENTVRYFLNFDKKMVQNLSRAREVLSHKMPGASDAEILSCALEDLLEKRDPLRRKARSAAEPKRRGLIRKAQGACTFKDPLTGQICGSRYQVEVDHIIPKACGGTDDPGNLRLLCRKHNLMMAERIFGSDYMRRFQLGPPIHE